MNFNVKNVLILGGVALTSLCIGYYAGEKIGEVKLGNDVLKITSTSEELMKMFQESLEKCVK